MKTLSCVSWGHEVLEQKEQNIKLILLWNKESSNWAHGCGKIPSLLKCIFKQNKIWAVNPPSTSLNLLKSKYSNYFLAKAHTYIKHFKFGKSLRKNFRGAIRNSGFRVSDHSSQFMAPHSSVYTLPFSGKLCPAVPSIITLTNTLFEGSIQI